MTAYNFSLLLIFFTLFQSTIVQKKTTFSFNDLGAESVFSKMILIAFFSMAGIPPLTGFFSKVFMFILLCGSNFSAAFPFFFLILFVSLYFYVQNVRFLNASNSANFQPIFELNVRAVPIFFYLSYAISFFLIFGAFYIDDLFLCSKWTLI